MHHFVGHPYRIVTKPLKRFADGSMKANFDIELAIDILTMSDRLDVVVLMSGDGDFRRVVELVASRGVRVEVVAFGETASSELKSVADLYIDIGAHLSEFKSETLSGRTRNEARSGLLASPTVAVVLLARPAVPVVSILLSGRASGALPRRLAAVAG